MKIYMHETSGCSIDCSGAFYYERSFIPSTLYSMFVQQLYDTIKERLVQQLYDTLKKRLVQL